MKPELTEVLEVVRRLGPVQAHRIAAEVGIGARTAGMRCRSLRTAGLVDFNRVDSDGRALWKIVPRTAGDYFGQMSDHAEQLAQHFAEKEPDEVLQHLMEEYADKWRRVAQNGSYEGARRLGL